MINNCLSRETCKITVTGPFVDAPADDLSVGEFDVVGTCATLGSLALDACDAYGIVWEDVTITPHTSA